MRPQRLRDCILLFAPPPLIMPLIAKSCTEFQISLCLFSLTSIFCNYANFNRLMQVQPLIALIRFIVTSKLYLPVFSYQLLVSYSYQIYSYQ